VNRTTVEHVVAHRPSTDTVEQAFNPELTAAGLRDDLTAIGCPIPEDDGEVLAEVSDAAEAIEVAERATDAVRERWANFGVAAEDYLDYVRSGRLPDPLTRNAATDVVRTLLTAEGRGERSYKRWCAVCMMAHSPEPMIIARRTGDASPCLCINSAAIIDMHGNQS
jgi:hypothetical protein